MSNQNLSQKIGYQNVCATYHVDEATLIAEYQTLQLSKIDLIKHIRKNHGIAGIIEAKRIANAIQILSRQ